jgi:hypothetical protein
VQRYAPEINKRMRPHLKMGRNFLEISVGRYGQRESRREPDESTHPASSGRPTFEPFLG